MIKDILFQNYIHDGNQAFEGWDFSFVTKTGRMQSELLPWSYGSMVKPLMQQADVVLDMGTGGGEFLSLLRPFPKEIVATEAYQPNYTIAQNRLEPLGVKVVALENEESLPFGTEKFDLILNRHEYYAPEELRRVMKDHGVFVTQQVGGMDCSAINEQLGVPVNGEYINWNLETAVKELEANDFQILFRKASFPIQRFYDIGALVYYLKAIPWQVPGFSVESFAEKLYDIHQQIQTKGYFDVKQHRFMIKARAN